MIINVFVELPSKTKTTKTMDIPLIIREISFDGILRVDAALEGDWNPTMVTVWTRDKGALGFSTVTRTHSTFKPSL